MQSVRHPSSPSSSPRGTQRRRSTRRRGACSARPSPTSSWSSSTTARSTGRAVRSRRSTTCGCASSETRRRSGSPARSNVGLENARGAYVARMDADDIALPTWLERVLARVRSEPAVAVVGSGMIDLHDGRATRHGASHADRRARGPLGRHLLVAVLPFDRRHRPAGSRRARAAVRHGVRGERGLRPLGAAPRLLPRETTSGRHSSSTGSTASQASARRAELQRECQRRVALRQLAALVPSLDRERAELAWLAGAGLPVPEGGADEAAAALAAAVEAFERRHGGREARRAAAWSLVRARGSAVDRAALARAALRLDPGRSRCGRWSASPGVGRQAHERDAAAAWLRSPAGDAPVRLTMVFPEPTPFRTVMLDRVAERPELDLTALYSDDSIARRTWTIRPTPSRGVPRWRQGSGPLPRAPARVSALAGCLSRAARVTARGRRRLRLEHVRRAGDGALVPASPRSLRCSSSRATSATRDRAGGAPSRRRSSPGWCVARPRCSSSARCLEWQ